MTNDEMRAAFEAVAGKIGVNYNEDDWLTRFGVFIHGYTAAMNKEKQAIAQLEHIFVWLNQNNDALTASDIVGAVKRMCNDVLDSKVILGNYPLDGIKYFSPEGCFLKSRCHECGELFDIDLGDDMIEYPSPSESFDVECSHGHVTTFQLDIDLTCKIVARPIDE